MSHKKDCTGVHIHRRIDVQWHKSVARNITSNIITNSTHHGPVPLVMLGQYRLLLTQVLDHQRSTQPTGCHLGFVGMYLGLGTCSLDQFGSVWQIFRHLSSIKWLHRSVVVTHRISISDEFIFWPRLNVTPLNNMLIMISMNDHDWMSLYRLKE